MRKLILSLPVAVWLVASGSAAQVSDATVRQARDETFNGRTASVVYAVQEGGSWSLVSIFSEPFSTRVAQEPEASRYWVARRQTGRNETFSRDVKWADSISCPQLDGVLWSLHHVEIPSFDIPGMTAAKPAEGVEPVLVPSHGPVFTIWGQGNQPSGALAWMRIQPFGGELATWGLNAERHLANCWAAEPPAPPIQRP